MDLGVMIEGQEGLNWELWRRIARATEELGFESLWRSDHLFSFSQRERDALEPFVSFCSSPKRPSASASDRSSAP